MGGPENFDTFKDVPYNIDFAWLTEVLNGVGNIAMFILGLVGWFVIMAMSIITALDIAYITMPTFQDLIRRKNWDGSQAERKFRIISKDAVRAVQINEERGREPGSIAIYVGLRIKTIFICGLLLSILVMGPGAIIGAITRVVKPIMELFKLV